MKTEQEIKDNRSRLVKEFEEETYTSKLQIWEGKIRACNMILNGAEEY